MRLKILTITAAVVLGAVGVVPADEPAPKDPNSPGSLTESVIVTAERPISAASENTIRDRDLSLRPISSPEDLLRVMPGLFVAQHAGGGKADQLFLRGFDADHGTDVAVSVDGVPNNLVSHAHGQGYADLHWLIPETLSGVETRKGTYFADQGDFGTAGSVNFVTRDRFDHSSIQGEAGSFETYRLVATGSPVVAGLDTVLAAEGIFTNGPFENPQETHRLNFFGKIGGPLSETTSFSLTATAYDGRWNASGQIPERAVEAGITRGRAEYFLDAQNLTNADFREAQFYNVSRLPNEPAPVGDLHFTPGNPKAIRIGVNYGL